MSKNKENKTANDVKVASESTKSTESKESAQRPEEVNKKAEASKQAPKQAENDKKSFGAKQGATSEKSEKNATSNPQKNSALKKAEKKPSLFSRSKGFIFWLTLLIAVAAAVFFTRKDLDWQVQHINDLQSKVAQLSQQNQALEVRLDTQINEVDARLLAMQEGLNQSVNTTIKHSLAQPENQPVITKADIDQLQHRTEQQMAQLQEKLGVLSAQAVEQVQQVISSASDLAETTEKALQPTDESKQAFAQIEANLQSQLKEVTGKLAELFDFKSTQQALSAERSQNEAKAVTTEKLAPTQVKQWVTEVNTQWLLRGNVEQSRTQLLALKSAIPLSQIEQADRLERLIAQDLAYLERHQTKSLQKKLDTTGLKQAIQALDSSHLSANHSAPVDGQGGGDISSDSATESPLTIDSALEQLKQTLGSMVSIKKRDAEQEITQVESLILHDVLIQRALLLVDRIDWAIVSSSSELLMRSVQDLQAYIDQTFPQSSAQFKAQLKPFLTHTFEARKPLAILNYADV